MITSRDKARLKLLKILSRNVLESLSGLERPWLANRIDLLNYAMQRWDENEVEEQINKILKVANS